MVRRRLGPRTLLAVGGLILLGRALRRQPPVVPPRLTVVPEKPLRPAAERADVPGRPRFYVSTGGDTGSVRHDSATGEGREDAMVLGAGRLLVGRSRDADLCLADAAVSPEHAELVVEPDGRTFVRDLGADNGVRVDGVLLPEAELFDGNRVELGTVTLLFHRDEGDGGNARDGLDRVDGA